MSEVALAAGALVIIVTAFAADEIVVLLGGEEYRPAGDVLRIQVVALLFIFLSQLWTTGLIALRRQRALIWINGVALVFVLACAGVLVPLEAAVGGAWATVLGDALLAALALWALHRAAPEAGPRPGLAPRLVVPVALAAAVAFLDLPPVASAVVAGAVFLVSAWLLRALPPELLDAVLRRRRPGL